MAVQDDCPDIRNRPADRNGICVFGGDLVKDHSDGRFRGAVGVCDRDMREHRSEFIHRVGHDGLAPDHNALQLAKPRPRFWVGSQIPDHLMKNRRHKIRDADVVLSDEPGKCFRVGHLIGGKYDRAAAARQRPEILPDGRVENRWRNGQNGIPRRRAKQFGHDREPVDNPPVKVDRSLRHSGRTRGEQTIHGVVGADIQSGV